MMIYSSGNANRSELLFLALGLCVASLLGLLIPVTPLLPLVLIIIGPVLLLLGALWPLAGLFVTAALAFEIIPAGLVMSLGSFRPHELMIVYLALIVILRTILRREPVFAPLAQFRWPMLFLVVCVSSSVVYVRYFAPNEFLLADLRNFVSWLLLPVLVLAVRTSADHRFYFRGMIVLGLAMSFIVIIQSVFDIRILTEARVESLDKGGNSDVTRSIAGGATYIMIFGLYYFMNLLARRKGSPLLLVIGSFIFAAGLAVTFGRGVWVATAAGLLLATFVNRGIRGVVITGILGAVVVAGMLGLGALVKPRLVEAIVDRATGVGEELNRGGSFAWRALENRAARIAIERRPLTGVGLGGEYKKTISAVDSFKNETWYIHNAYMAYAVKMGVFAALFPIWMILTFAVAARQILQNSSANNRPLQAALIGAFIVPVITSYTQPEWFDGRSVVAFCLVIAGLLISSQARFQEMEDVRR